MKFKKSLQIAAFLNIVSKKDEVAQMIVSAEQLGAVVLMDNAKIVAILTFVRLIKEEHQY